MIVTTVGAKVTAAALRVQKTPLKKASCSSEKRFISLPINNAAGISDNANTNSPIP